MQRIAGVAVQPERIQIRSTGKLLLEARGVDAERAVDDGLARRSGKHVGEVLANLSVQEQGVGLHAARGIVRARDRDEGGVDFEDGREISDELLEDRRAFRARDRERSLRQRILRALAVRDVCRHAADRVRLSVGLEQRKLPREERLALPGDGRGELVFGGRPRREHLGVVRHELRDVLRRPQLVVGVPDGALGRHPRRPLELAVREDVATREVLHDDDGFGMVEDLLQPRAGVGSDPPALTKVRKVVDIRDDAAGVVRIQRQVDERMHAAALAVPELPGEPLRQARPGCLPAPLPAFGGESAIGLKLRAELEQRFPHECGGVEAHEAREALVAFGDGFGQMHDTVHLFERGPGETLLH